MTEKKAKSSTLREDDLLDELIKDPTLSLSELARKIGKGKTSTWRRKKNMEENNTILGYTTVVDETKFGWQLYITLLKGKVQTEESTKKAIEHVLEDLGSRLGIRSISTYFTMGEYDFVLLFAAKDTTTVKKYIDLIRSRYADFIEGRPLLLNVTFALRREGVVNPDLEQMTELMLKEI